MSRLSEMESVVSFRRWPLAEGWSLNTFHQAHKAAMEVHLRHTDGRYATLVLSNDDMMDDMAACKTRLFNWVAEVTMDTAKTRQIDLKD